MKFVLAILILTSLAFVLINHHRSHIAHVQELSGHLEHLNQKINHDSLAGRCDFSLLYKAHQLGTELATINSAPYGPYPYTRTSGVVSLDDLPAYLVVQPSTRPAVDTAAAEKES